MKLFTPVVVGSIINCIPVLKSKKKIGNNKMVTIEMYFKNSDTETVGFSSSNLLIMGKE